MKFEIGSKWKTRGGWKAMIVDYHQDHARPIKVYHYNGNYISEHLEGGELAAHKGGAVSLHDIIEPWQDPVEHEGWVYIFKNQKTGDVFPDHNLYKKPYCGEKDHPPNKSDNRHIACIKIKFTEGEGLE